MAKRRFRTPGEKVAQKNRSDKNKIRKYDKMIKNNPESPDVKIWQAKLKEIR